jgi:hypothetical protein
LIFRKKRKTNKNKQVFKIVENDRMGNQLTWAGVLIVASFIGGLFLGKNTTDKAPLGDTAELALEQDASTEAQGGAEDSASADSLVQNQIIEEQRSEIQKLMGQVVELQMQNGELQLQTSQSIPEQVAPKSPDWKPETGALIDPKNTGPETAQGLAKGAASAAPQRAEVNVAVEQPQQQEPSKPKVPTIEELEDKLVSGSENALQTLASVRWKDLAKEMGDVRPIPQSLIERLPEGTYVGSSSLGSYRLTVARTPKRNQAPVYLAISEDVTCDWEWSEVVQPKSSTNGFALECDNQTLQIYPKLQGDKGYTGEAHLVEEHTDCLIS